MTATDTMVRPPGMRPGTAPSHHATRATRSGSHVPTYGRPTSARMSVGAYNASGAVLATAEVDAGNENPADDFVPAAKDPTVEEPAVEEPSDAVVAQRSASILPTPASSGAVAATPAMAPGASNVTLTVEVTQAPSYNSSHAEGGHRGAPVVTPDATLSPVLQRPSGDAPSRAASR